MRAIAILWMVSMACAGCALGTGETESEPATGEAQDADSQDTPVTLPHAGPFSITQGQVLLGHPFPVAAHAQVTVTASAHWGFPQCPVRMYEVGLREFGFFGAELPVKNYPTGGAAHTERWTVPRAGQYRLEITITDHPGCRPLAGQVVITSP